MSPRDPNLISVIPGNQFEGPYTPRSRVKAGWEKPHPKEGRLLAALSAALLGDLG